MRSKWSSLAVALSFMVTLGGSVHAQIITRGDSAAVLLDAADQLRVRGEVEAARALLQFIAQQYAGTPAADLVSQRLAIVRRMPEAERSGRTELIVFGTTYGAWLGIALPIIVDADDAAAYGLGLLMGAPTGFFAARSYANSKMPTYGQTRAITFGGLWGTYTGFALAELLDLGGGETVVCPVPENSSSCYTIDEGDDGSTFVASAIGGGLLGIAVGAVAARKPITAGTAATVSLGGMWGTWFGFAISVLADREGDGLLAGTMIGGNAALLGMALTAPGWNVSENRARLASLGGLVGGLAGAGALMIAQPDNDKVAVAFPLVGSIGGLIAGIHLTRDRDLIDDAGGHGALINRNDGRWALDMPDAALRLQRSTTGELRPAAYVPIFSARF